MQIGCRGPNALQHARLVGASMDGTTENSPAFDRQAAWRAGRLRGVRRLGRLCWRCGQRYRLQRWRRLPVGRQSAKAATGTATSTQTQLVFQNRTRDRAEHHVDGIIFFLETFSDEREARSRHCASLDLPTELIELMRVGADIRDGRGPSPRTKPTQRIGEGERVLDFVTPGTALFLVDFSALLG